MNGNWKTRGIAFLLMLTLISLSAGAQATVFLDLGDNYYMELPDDFTYESEDEDEETILYYSEEQNMTVVQRTSWEDKDKTLKDILIEYIQQGINPAYIDTIHGIDIARGQYKNALQVIDYGAVRGTEDLTRVTTIRPKGSDQASKTVSGFYASLRDHTLTSLKMNKTSHTMIYQKKPKSTFQLQLIREPAYSVSKILWTSSDDDVATVNDRGLVTARGEGECVILAIAEDGSGLTAACDIRVKASKEIPVTAIKLNKSSKTLTIKGGKYPSFQLTARVSPSDATNPDILWSSSDPDVAVVNGSGRVSAVGTGTCVIFATAEDGSGVEASCVVKVKKKKAEPIPAESITLNVTNMTVKLSEIHTFQLTATADPAEAELGWMSSNPDIADVSSTGEVVFHHKGTCTITVFSVADKTVRATCKIKVKK